MKNTIIIGYLSTAIALFAAPGCMSSSKEQAEMSPEMGRHFLPESVPESVHAPSQEASRTASYATLKVYYGTNRTPNYLAENPRQLSPDEYFGIDLWRELSYGSCEVSIPETHKYGEIERPNIWKFEFREDPEKHIVLQSVTPATEGTTLAEISRDVQQSRRQQAFVFVHGYNVSFAKAARRTAQMAYDLKFDGPPIFFSWPSDSRLANYVEDLEDAGHSGTYLQRFLEQVATNTGAREVHLIAHSMGNRVLTDALQLMPPDPAVKFNEVLLAAPDIDAETFKNDIAPRIMDRADRLTIYASSNDKALQVSESLHRRRRLGQGGDQLPPLPPELSQIDMVDASNIDFSWFELGHSAYGNELLADVKLTLRGISAPERDLSRHQSKLAWIFRPSQNLLPVGYEEEEPHSSPEPRKSWWQRLIWWR